MKSTKLIGGKIDTLSFQVDHEEDRILVTTKNDEENSLVIHEPKRLESDAAGYTQELLRQCEVHLRIVEKHLETSTSRLEAETENKRAMEFSISLLSSEFIKLVIGVCSIFTRIRFFKSLRSQSDARITDAKREEIAYTSIKKVFEVLKGSLAKCMEKEPDTELRTAIDNCIQKISAIEWAYRRLINIAQNMERARRGMQAILFEEEKPEI